MVWGVRCTNLMTQAIRYFSTERVLPVYKPSGKDYWKLLNSASRLDIEEIETQNWQSIKAKIHVEGKGLQEAPVFVNQNSTTGFTPIKTFGAETFISKN